MNAILSFSRVREHSAYLRQVSTALRQDRQKLKVFLSEQKKGADTHDLRLFVELAELPHRLVLATELLSQLLLPL